MPTFEFEFEPELDRLRAEQQTRSIALRESLDRVEEWRRSEAAAAEELEKIVQRRRVTLDHLGSGSLRNAELTRETERLASLGRVIEDRTRVLTEITRDLEWAEERASLRRSELEKTVTELTMLERLRSERLLEWNREQRRRKDDR